MSAPAVAAAAISPASSGASALPVAPAPVPAPVQQQPTLAASSSSAGLPVASSAPSGSLPNGQSNSGVAASVPHPQPQRTAGLRRTRRWRPPSTSGVTNGAPAPAMSPVSDEGPVPLEAVTLRAVVHDYNATVTVQQTYVNTEEDPIEVRYVFPLDESSAVCSFEAMLDSQLIRGVVYERKEAKDTYDKAIASGKPAALLEQESPDVFVTLLGNLMPGKRCTINITYVAELSTSRGIIRFVLPTVCAPRYSNTSSALASTSGARRPAAAIPYRLSLRVDVSMPSDLRRITSSSHDIAIETRAAHRAIVTLKDGSTQLDQDFVLSIEQSKPYGSRALLERWSDVDINADSTAPTALPSSPKSETEKAAAAENKDSVALQVTFCEPYLEAKDVKDSDTRAELIFLVDTSSSMAGSRLEHTKLALRAFLSALPRRAKFNLFQFNRHYSSLFPASQDVTTDTLRTAGDYITALNYDYGTEILGPLRAIFGLPHLEGYARQIFVLTDGEVAQPELSIALTKQHSDTTRLFCYGVGSSVSTALVNGLARAGCGEATFIQHNAQIAATIASSLAAAIQPAISQVTVDWSGAYTAAGEAKTAATDTTSATSGVAKRVDTRIAQCPRALPPVYPGSRYFVYGVMSRGSALRDSFDVTIRATFSNGGVKTFIVPVTSERHTLAGRVVHTLAARSRIRELEGPCRSDPVAAAEMVALSTRYQLASPLASFVAVPHGASPTSAPSAKPVQRSVPTGAPKDVGGITDQMGGLRVSAQQATSAAPGQSVTATPNNSVLGQASSATSTSATAAAGKRPAISYAAERVIGNGSFGVVYQATVLETGEVIAIKKVLQDRRFKNRELAIMGMLDHPTVITLKHCFYSKGDKPDEVFLNLVMEFIPETIHRTLRTHTKAKKLIPLINTKLYMYQLCRGLSYLHSLGICHRDIKPQNLLLDTRTHHVKICDFGSAKILVKGETNVAYICSRYYRAPELVFEATDYTTTIDIWSLGCVFAELLLGTPLCPGDSSVDQLIEIIKVLGTPTREEVLAMNPHQSSFKFPQIAAQPWNKVFRGKAPADAIDLVSQFLRYDPKQRLDPFDALCHPFFDELRGSSARLPNAKPLPNIFNFVDSELTLMVARGHTRKLCPPDLIKKFQAAGKLPKTI